MIAYLASEFPSLSETFVLREIEGLRARGHQVDVHCLRAGKTWAPGVSTPLYGQGTGQLLSAILAEAFSHPIATLGTLWQAVRDALSATDISSAKDRAKVAAQSFVALALAHRLRKAGARHLHCHFAHAPTTIGMYAARQARIPFSFTGHANDLFQRRALLPAKLARAKFVSSISEWHRALYESVRPRPADEYPIIRCGVDTDTWRPVPHKTERFNIITVGRLVEKKGVDLLLRALPLLPDDVRPHVTVHVVGDGPERQKLEALPVPPGSQVVFHGAQPNDKVFDLVRSADAFALPCRTDRHGDKDGIPVVLMEAMACGVPSIAGDLPAIRELVRDNATGLISKPEDPASVADAIVRLYRDVGFREAVSSAGREHVVSEFSLAVNIRRLEGRLFADISEVHA